MDTHRKTDLREMLLERRREVADVIRKKTRVNCEGSSLRRSDEVLDSGEVAEVDVRDDIELALIQMKADTLNRVDQALGRLDRDVYGICLDCSGEIAEKRLRALPFAVRCKDCEEIREGNEQRERELSSRRNSLGLLFVDNGPRFDS